MKWSVFPSPSFVKFMLVAPMLVLGCTSPDVQSTDTGRAPKTTPEVSPQHSAATSIEPPILDASSDAPFEPVFDASSDAPFASDAPTDGSLDSDAESDASTPPPACPPEMTHIGRYCVDRWEGHLVIKNSDGATAVWPHFTRPENATFFAQSAAGVFPQGYISRVEAKEACTHSGKRLCSRAEWMRACKGSRGFRYPYGNEGKRGACNTGKPHLLFTFFGAKRGGWSYENFNDPKLDQEPGFLAKSGEYEKCQSNEDVHDIVGNLHEWINDDVGTDIEQVLEKDGVERKEQPWRAGNGMFMGGFFSTTVEHGPGCTYTTIAHEPTYHDYSTGFRCCKTAVLPDKPSKSKGKTKK